MNLFRAAPVFSLAIALAAALPAQQTKVVPAGMNHVEGPLVFTYPFGRTDGAIQILFDADQISLSQAVITAISFRPSQSTSSATGYTKNYRVTAYVVATPASQMVADLLTNTGGVTGTVVFNGPLTLPSIGPLQFTPGPWNIRIPFTPPFLFDGSQGNLLLLVETADMVPPNSGSYRIDTVLFRNSTIEGIVADIDVTNCTVGGSNLTITADNTQAIVGGAIDVSVTASQTGAFPAVFALLSLTRTDWDLGAIGLTGCNGFIQQNFVWQLLLENAGGGHPNATWALPALPALEGLATINQCVGLANPGSFAGAAASNALAIRIGSSSFPLQKVMAAHRSSSGWFIGRAGEFTPVVRFEGVFP